MRPIGHSVQGRRRRSAPPVVHLCHVCTAVPRVWEGRVGLGGAGRGPGRHARGPRAGTPLARQAAWSCIPSSVIGGTGGWGRRPSESAPRPPDRRARSPSRGCCTLLGPRERGWAALADARGLLAGMAAMPPTTLQQLPPQPLRRSHLWCPATAPHVGGEFVVAANIGAAHSAPRAREPKSAASRRAACPLCTNKRMSGPMGAAWLGWRAAAQQANQGLPHAPHALRSAGACMTLLTGRIGGCVRAQGVQCPGRLPQPHRRSHPPPVVGKLLRARFSAPVKPSPCCPDGVPGLHNAACWLTRSRPGAAPAHAPLRLLAVRLVAGGARRPVGAEWQLTSSGSQTE